MPLDWLADAGLAPPVLEELVRLEAEVWKGTLPRDLLELVRSRVRTLVDDLDERDRAVVRWAEQFVIDPHGISDADRAALTAVLDDRQLGELTTAVAVFEALARTRVALEAT